MKNRKLNLRRESVSDLASDELGRIAGGSAGTCYTCVLDCVTPALINDPGPIPTLDYCFTHHSLVDCLSDRVCN